MDVADPRIAVPMRTTPPADDAEDDPGSAVPPPADTRRVRDKLAERAKQRPPVFQGRGLATGALAVVVLGVVVAQWTGLARSGPAERIRKERASESRPPVARADEDGAAPAKPAPPTAPPPVAPPSVPRGAEGMPPGLDPAYERALRRDLDTATDASAMSMARADALRDLPAVAAAAPEASRRAVRGRVLREIAPIAASDGPLAALALESAAWILGDEPEADPDAARRILADGALRRLRAPPGAEAELAPAVEVARLAREPERAEAQRVLKAVVLDASRPVALRVAAAAALDAAQVEGAVRGLAADPGTNPLLRAAIEARAPR
jgi:hypothetical protein